MPQNRHEQAEVTRRGPDGRFRKGVSGNPGGRPKEVGYVRDLARQHTEEAIKTLVAIMQDPTQPGRVRVAAAEAILDRGWGRPTQPIGGDDTMEPIRLAVQEETLRAFIEAVARRQAG